MLVSSRFVLYTLTESVVWLVMRVVVGGCLSGSVPCYVASGVTAGVAGVARYVVSRVAGRQWPGCRKGEAGKHEDGWRRRR